NRLTSASEYALSGTPSTTCSDTNARWCEAYSYGFAGNRTISARKNLTPSVLEATAYDTANRATTGGQAGSFLYDARGNMTRDPQPTATNSSSPASYAYDGENRLVAYCPQGGTCTTGTTGATVYQYDPESHRA